MGTNREVKQPYRHERGGPTYAERAEWMHQLRQMKLKISNLEKERWHLPRGGSEEMKKDFTALHTEELHDEQKRAHFQLQAKTDLRKVRRDLNEAEGLVAQVQQGKESASNLQSALEMVEQAMLDFKLSRRQDYEDLLTEERVLSRELATMLNHFEAWQIEGVHVGKVSSATAIGEKGKNASTTMLSSSTGRRPETTEGDDADDDDDNDDEGGEGSSWEAQVQALDRKIVCEGGPTGGWHPKEHEIFLGLWTQVKVVSSNQSHEAEDLVNEEMINVLDRSAMILRDRSESEVAEHLRWYMRYLRMAADKRRLIHQWRSEKNREREAALRREAEEEAKLNPLLRSRGVSSTAELSVQERERLKKKQMVEAWKEKKVQEAAQKHEEERRRKEEEERIREDKERKEASRKKQQVELYKVEKEEEKRRQAEVKRREEEAQRKREAEEWASHHVDLSSRTRETLEKARQRRQEVASKALERKQEERYEKQKKILEVAAQEPIPEGGHRKTPRYVYRDPDRLVRPTTASKVREYTDQELEEKEKARQSAGAHERPMAGMGRDLQWGGRAKPDWCRGVV